MNEFQPVIQPTADQPFWGMSTTPEGVQIEAIGTSAVDLERNLRAGEREAKAINAILNPDAPAKTVNRSIRVPVVAKHPWRVTDGIEHPVTVRKVEKAKCWHEFCCNPATLNVARHPSGNLYGYCEQHKGDIYPYDGTNVHVWDGMSIAEIAEALVRGE